MRVSSGDQAQCDSVFIIIILFFRTTAEPAVFMGSPVLANGVVLTSKDLRLKPQAAASS